MCKEFPDTNRKIVFYTVNKHYNFLKINITIFIIRSDIKVIGIPAIKQINSLWWRQFMQGISSKNIEKKMPR